MISVGVGAPGAGGSAGPRVGGGRGGGNDESKPAPCLWVPWGGTRVTDGILYRSYTRVCNPAGGSRTVEGFWFADASPADVAARAWAAALARVPRPSFGSAPPSDSTIVKYDTWLWTDPGDYVPVSATATVATLNGPLSATVTARPLRLVFDPGEPDSVPVVCDGPGQQWQPGTSTIATSACMYAYRHSSEITDSGTFPATWSTIWEVTWTSTTGANGTLDDSYTTTTDRPITVKEVQALIVE